MQLTDSAPKNYLTIAPALGFTVAGSAESFRYYAAPGLILIAEMGSPVTLAVTLERADSWFWSEVWQRGELEASDDIAAARIDHYLSGDEFLASLED